MRYIVAYSLIGCIVVFVAIVLAVYLHRRRRRRDAVWGKRDRF